MTRYEIALKTGVSQAALSRFMSGERGLTTLTVDRLGILFDLEIVPRVRKRA
jgi:predicted transcriptional regulator